MAATDDEKRGFASPACLLHEADGAYADPKFSAVETIAALNRLVEEERSAAALAARSIQETRAPGYLTIFLRRGRIVARHVKLLIGWIEKLGSAPSLAIRELAPGMASLEDRRAVVTASEDDVVRQLDELLPRLDEPDLHAELVKIRDLYLNGRDLPGLR